MTVTVSTNSILSSSLGYLRAMLGDCQTWRAWVAQPNTDWTTLAALIAAATSPSAAALAKVKYGVLEEDATHGDYVTVPRIAIRFPDSGDIERIATTGFASALTMIVSIEASVPDTYEDSYQDAYVDFMNKVGGVLKELNGLGSTAGYLDLKRVQIGPIGMIDPDYNNGLEWMAAELLIVAAGGNA